MTGSMTANTQWFGGGSIVKVSVKSLCVTGDETCAWSFRKDKTLKPIPSLSPKRFVLKLSFETPLPVSRDLQTGSPVSCSSELTKERPPL